MSTKSGKASVNSQRLTVAKNRMKNKLAEVHKEKRLLSNTIEKYYNKITKDAELFFKNESAEKGMGSFAYQEVFTSLEKCWTTLFDFRMEVIELTNLSEDEEDDFYSCQGDADQESLHSFTQQKGATGTHKTDEQKCLPSRRTSQTNMNSAGSSILTSTTESLISSSCASIPQLSQVPVSLSTSRNSLAGPAVTSANAGTIIPTLPLPSNANVIPIISADKSLALNQPHSSLQNVHDQVAQCSFVIKQPIFGDEYQVESSFVISLSDFYIKIKTADRDIETSQLQWHLRNVQTTPLYYVPQKLSLYLCHYMNQNEYHRVQVLDVQQEGPLFTCLVFYIDHGLKQSVLSSSLALMDQSLASIPAMVYHCSLDKTYPNPTENSWSRRCIEEFKSLLSADCKTTPLSGVFTRLGSTLATGPQYMVDLRLKWDNIPISISDYLAEENLVTVEEESPVEEVNELVSHPQVESIAQQSAQTKQWNISAKEFKSTFVPEMHSNAATKQSASDLQDKISAKLQGLLLDEAQNQTVGQLQPTGTTAYQKQTVQSQVTTDFENRNKFSNNSAKDQQNTQRSHGPERRLSNASEGDRRRVSEGRLSNASEGDRRRVSEGRLSNASEGDRRRVSEGRLSNASEGDRRRVSEGCHSLPPEGSHSHSERRQSRSPVVHKSYKPEVRHSHSLEGHQSPVSEGYQSSASVEHQNRTSEDQRSRSSVESRSPASGEDQGQSGSSCKSTTEPTSRAQLCIPQNPVVEHWEEYSKDLSSYVVSVANSPIDFYVHQLTENTDVIDYQHDAMNKHYRNPDLMYEVSEHVSEGSVWACKYPEDDSWYRVEVLQILVQNTGARPKKSLSNPQLFSSQKVLVCFVDWGDTIERSVSDLRPLIPDFYKNPRFAIPCVLAGLIPPDNRATWPEKTCNRLSELIGNDKTISVLVNDRLPNGQLNVYVWMVDGRNDILVNTLLVEEGLASHLNKEDATPSNLQNGLAHEGDNEKHTLTNGEVNGVMNGECESITAALDKWDPMGDAYNSAQNNYAAYDDDPEFAFTGHKSNDGKQVCHYFNMGRKCPRGDVCPFSHIMMTDGITRDRTEEICSIPSLSLPPTGSYLYAQVSAVFSPAHFFLVFPYGRMNFWDIKNSDERIEDSLGTLGKEMTKTYNNNRFTEDLSEVLPLGCVVAAQSNLTDKWFRGTITNIQANSHYDIYFVDYGTEERIHRKNIRKLHQQYAHLPAQALECRMDLEPKDNSGWSSEVETFFQKHVEKQNVLALIQAPWTNKEIARVRLFVVSRGRNLDIGEELIKQNLARRILVKEDCAFYDSVQPG